jgi:CubicO group peptidase (beta-lactamase class C family)
VKAFFPDFTRPVTWMHLLTHTSGLPDWHPFYLFTREDFPAISLFHRLNPRHLPGEKVVYSCVGYMLLRRLIEKVTGQEFQKTAQEIIFRRLALKNTFFSVPAERIQQTAPTEKGNLHEKSMCRKNFDRRATAFAWRETIIRGRVHDANSFYFGGCAGNAGLFSTAGDLLKISREFFPETSTILSPESIRLFWTDGIGRGPRRRTVGFKLNSPFFSSGGTPLSRQAIGHNGFTGTSIWLDPRTLSTWIILSNRIHPFVQPIRFDRIRRKLHRLLKREFLGE